MNRNRLLWRALRHHWRTSLAATLGVSAAIATLSGALLMGGAVRASLRALARGEIGRTAFAIRAPEFVQASFVERLEARPEFATAYTGCPLIAVQGFVTREASGAPDPKVAVYGIDDRFWTLQGRRGVALDRNDAYLSEALARDVGAKAGDAIIVRLEHRSVISAESLFGRKDDVGRTVRLSVRGVLGDAELGGFSLRPRQEAVRALFTPLARLQRALDRPRQINTVLVAAKSGQPEADPAAAAAALSALAGRAAAPEDAGISITPLPGASTLVVEQAGGVLDDAIARAADAAASDMGLTARPVFSYFASALRAGDRLIPYSIVTAIDLRAIAPGVARRPVESLPSPGAPAPPNDQSPFEDPAVVLNDWAARDLHVRVGDAIWISYFVWEPEGSLRTEMARFRLAAVVPVQGVAAEPRLVPPYPGISGGDRIADWDPPFPIDRSEVRPIDEDYWRRYRTTPKAFIPLDVGQRLWGSRHGRVTSLRVMTGGRDLSSTAAEYRAHLRARLGPAALGLATHAVRAEALEASRGAADFSVYFAGWSVALVGSALLLAAWIFRAGVERRAREIGALSAAGLPVPAIRALIRREAVAVAALGGLAGLAGAAGYGWLLMYGLRTWWVGAVGTTALRLHVTPASFVLAAAGAVGGAVVAACILNLTTRDAAGAPPRRLLEGRVAPDPLGSVGPQPFFLPLLLALVTGLSGVTLAAAALARLMPVDLAFLGVGGLLLVASLAYLTYWLRRRNHHLIDGSGWRALSRLGVRAAACRPGRSVRGVALVAAVVFVIVTADAFRHDDEAQALARNGGTGGYPLLAESLVPVVHDLNTVTGRTAIGFELPPGLPFSAARFTRLRLRSGDDASRRNLFRPIVPRILGVGRDLVGSDRFAFGRTLAGTPEEEAHPWTLLERERPDGEVPVIADATSMADALHVKVGDTMTMLDTGGRPVTLRFVAALRDSILQSAVLMSERDFTRLFPDEQGYRAFLIDVEPRWAPALAKRLEKALATFGFTVTPASDELASFHAVEDARLSIFQALTACALILGTLGLAVLTWRHAGERRREVAVLRAVGYTPSDLAVMFLAEGALLFLLGLAIGLGCGLIATAPAFVARGGTLPDSWLLAMLGAAALTGLLSLLAAAIAVARTPFLDALRAE